MKTILVFVQTLDGKITKWRNPFVKSWSSREDQQYFSELMKSRLIIMGSNTYQVDQTKPKPGKLLIVMTSHPEEYKAKEIPGQIEFSSLSPTELVKRFSKEGFRELLMVGGAKSATSFLKDHMIDEIWMTIEPSIFGSGKSFVTEEELDIELRLLSAVRINKKGTMLMKYSVVK